ncbi:ATP-binding protein [Salipiger abyssi]|uniref:ATP-binding protein n=1 Tax=Salipiger abyssi TaxID=1250539 RepID=UPI0040598F7F
MSRETRLPGVLTGRGSLQWSLILVLVLGLVVPISLLAFHTHKERKTALLTELRQHLAEVTEVLASGLVAPTWNLDAEAARPLLDAVMSDERVVDITVYTELIPRFLQASRPERRSSVGRPLLMQRAIYRGDEKIAFVVVEMSTARMEEALRLEEAQILRTAVGQFGVSMLMILFFLQLKIVRPLRSLALSAQSVAAGVLDTRVDTSGWGEVGRLGESFDSMRRALQANFRQTRAQQKELQESEALKRAVIDSTLDGLVTVAADGRIVDFNPAAEKIFRMKRDAVVGKPFAEVVWLPEDSLPERGGLPPDTHSHPSTIFNPRKEISLASPERAHFPAEMTVSEVLLPQERFFVIQLRDLSRRKAIERDKTRLEEQLAQSQKMEALGTMASGIAHDVNNILGVAVGAAEIATDLTPEDGAARKYLARVLEAGARGRALVEQILSFASPSSKHRTALSAVGHIRGCVRAFSESAPPEVSIRFASDVEDAVIYADPVQISQVLDNILLNALDAMPEGGRIEVTLLREHRPDSDDGDALSLSISDTGTGMDEATCRRIFDGFFTTKGTGHGLGLTLAHGIVASHGGSLSVSSAPGEGSRFTICLPIHEGAADGTAAPAGARQQPRAARFERAMVVDDEDQLAETTELALRELFAEVERFSDPAEALSAFRARGRDAYDLIVTDYAMPGMTGVDLARALRQDRPQLPILLYSGILKDAVAEEARRIGLDAVLTKPFFRQELLDTVLRVMTARAA